MDPWQYSVDQQTGEVTPIEMPPWCQLFQDWDLTTAPPRYWPAPIDAQRRWLVHLILHLRRMAAMARKIKPLDLNGRVLSAVKRAGSASYGRTPAETRDRFLTICLRALQIGAADRPLANFLSLSDLVDFAPVCRIVRAEVESLFRYVILETDERKRMRTLCPDDSAAAILARLQNGGAIIEAALDDLESNDTDRGGY